MEGGLNPSPEPSPDDLSSPVPDQATPLLQAQQRPPSRAERDETQPISASPKIDAETIAERGAVTEEVDFQSSLNGGQSEQEGAVEKDTEQEMVEEKDCEDKETEDRDMIDEGLPPSKGSEDESEEESEELKEPSDTNHNSLETPQEDQDEFIDIPEALAQVGHADLDKGLCLTGKKQ